LIPIQLRYTRGPWLRSGFRLLAHASKAAQVRVLSSAP